MTLYDVFRRLVEARPFQDYERREALALLDEAEQLNVFGTMARQLAEGHDHEWIVMAPNWRKCKVCSLEEAVFK